MRVKMGVKEGVKEGVKRGVNSLRSWFIATRFTSCEA